MSFKNPIYLQICKSILNYEAKPSVSIEVLVTIRDITYNP